MNQFATASAKFKTIVRQHYPGPTVLFLVCRVGNDGAANTSLETLNQNTAINDMVLYSEGRLDSKLKEMKENVDHYTGWVRFSPVCTKK